MSFSTDSESKDSGPRAAWPLYVDASIRDYGPLEIAEWAIFSRIVSRAGWNGGWCREGAPAMAEAFADISDRVVRDVRTFLVTARMVRKKTVPGYADEYQPLPMDEWVDPQQLPLIRDRIYAYRRRKKKIETDTNLELLLMRQADKAKQSHIQHSQ